MISREQRTPFSEWWWTVDRPLLAAIIALMLGGLILSLAASPPVATRIGLDPFHFFNRHVLFLLPAFIVLIGVSFLSPRQIRRTALIVLALSIALIVATLLFGPEVKGSRRWITLIGVNIQAPNPPSPPSW
jgi:Bacterial cell division membrane protein